MNMESLSASASFAAVGFSCWTRNAIKHPQVMLYGSGDLGVAERDWCGGFPQLVNVSLKVEQVRAQRTPLNVTVIVSNFLPITCLSCQVFVILLGIEQVQHRSVLVSVARGLPRRLTSSQPIWMVSRTYLWTRCNTRCGGAT